LFEIKVDKELLIIITFMEKDPIVNKAIRRYARAFIGEKKWREVEKSLH